MDFETSEYLTYIARLQVLEELKSLNSRGKRKYSQISVAEDESDALSLRDNSYLFYEPHVLNAIAHIDEILDCIFGFLDDVTIFVNIMQVCRRWDRIGWDRADKYAITDYSFQNACKLGYTGCVRRMLCNPAINPASGGNLPIQIAAENNRVDVVRLMLNDNRVDPTADGCLTLTWACKYKCHETIRLLLQDNRIVDAISNMETFVGLCKFATPELLAFYFEKLNGRITASDIKKAILTALISDNVNAASRLYKFSLSQPDECRIDPSADKNALIATAAVHHANDLVRLLLQDPRVDPSVKDNVVLIFICKKGDDAELVDMLLRKYPNVNPAAQDNSALIYAAKNGCVNVVDRLLQDPRVDATMADNKSLVLVQACRNGYHLVVQRLLRDPKTDPNNCKVSCLSSFHYNSYTSTRALDYAVRNGKVSVVRVLLQDKRVDPSRDECGIVFEAKRLARDAGWNTVKKANYMEIYYMLLRHPKVQASGVEIK